MNELSLGIIRRVRKHLGMDLFVSKPKKYLPQPFDSGIYNCAGAARADHHFRLRASSRAQATTVAFVMLKAFKHDLNPSTPSSAAKTFSRLGWIGFWVQVALCAFPLLLTLNTLHVAGEVTRGRFLLVEALSIAGLAVLLFTALRPYRSTRLGKRIADPARRSVQRAASIGVAAAALGIISSILVMLAEVVALFSYLLRAPHAGVPVMQSAGTGQPSRVSAPDIISLLSLLSSTWGELIVLAFGRWLLYRSLASADSSCRAGCK
jgi:hypothetical protein